MALACGIDFGTSNSTLAVVADGAVQLVPLEGDSVTLPSALFYPPRGAPLFGRQAVRQFIDGEDGRFMRSLKRILGTSIMGQGTVVNGRSKPFEEILGDFIGHMKRDAESRLGQDIDRVVMGRPVHFVDGDAQADANAQTELERVARSVGFTEVAFQYEPIAAAFAHERRLSGEKLALVVDIGGGTSDFTVIRLSGPAAVIKADRAEDILANSGVRIGGNDFDKDLCLSCFMPPLGLRSTYGSRGLDMPVGPFFDMAEWSKVNFLYTPKTRSDIAGLYAQANDKEQFGRFVKILHDETGHQLLDTVESCKIALTHDEDVTASLDFVERDLSIPVARTAFDRAVEKHVHGISRAVTECLRQAGIRDEQIELVILTGGTTEVPLLHAAIRSRFPNAALSEDNKLASVGLGLGYDSLRRFG